MFNTSVIMFNACMNSMALFTYLLTVVASGIVATPGFRCPRPWFRWWRGWRSLCAGAVVFVLAPALRCVVGFRLWPVIVSRPCRWCRLCFVGIRVGSLLSSPPFSSLEFVPWSPVLVTCCPVAAAHLTLLPWFRFRVPPRLVSVETGTWTMSLSTTTVARVGRCIDNGVVLSARGGSGTLPA